MSMKRGQMRRNCALTTKQFLKFYIALVCLSLIVATGFLLAGIWVVPIFTALELSAVTIGFLIYCRHALDCETIEIDGNRLIIKKFIIEKKRKIYGGYALHLLLLEKNKSTIIYEENDIYDIDFYSPEPIIDLKELCDKIYAAGFKPVLGQEAQHKETYSVYVNYQLYCDITYMPNNIYKKLRFMFINICNSINILNS